MDLQSHIGKKVKLDIVIDDKRLTYTALIVSSGPMQTAFIDKFGKRMEVSGDSIKAVEEIVE